jgi:CBS domain-containing protein
MNGTTRAEASIRMKLEAVTARDLMRRNPISINADAVLREAIAFLIDKGFGAAPVIDEAGRPVGVISRTDILIHDRARVDYVPTRPELYAEPGETEREVPRGFQIESVDKTLVRDVMTPVVFSVSPDTPARKVIEDMLSLRVHRLFVVGASGELVGIISSFDVLRHLRPENGDRESDLPAGLDEEAPAGFDPW